MRKNFSKALALIASVAVVALLVACPQGGNTVINNYYTGQQNAETQSEFKKIPSGSYYVLYNGTDGDTTTVAEVVLSSYYICDHEVTQAEWLKVFDVNPSLCQGDDENKKVAEGEVQENRPVDNVSWYAAIAYCNKRSIKEGLEPVYEVRVLNTETHLKEPVNWETLKFEDIPTTNNSDWNDVSWDWTKNGYRLPTEAEWEVAARGGNTATVKMYPGTFSSKRVDFFAWTSQNSGESLAKVKTHEVKKKLPNEYGLYDMAGNVCEWCFDEYDISLKYPATTLDPVAGLIIASSKRIYRGGDCRTANDRTYVSNRSNGCFASSEGLSQYFFIGLRVVRNAL